MAKADVIKQIRKATHRKFSAEEKIRIVLEGFRGEISIEELCRREAIAANVYYRWSKAFLDADNFPVAKFAFSALYNEDSNS